LVVSIHDVSEREELRRRLAFQAAHDGLTGLANRSQFTHQATAALNAQRAQGGAMSAILYLDLNLFKPVNDQFGHAAGDQVLRECAARLRGCVRTADLVARLGGDEFAILLCGSTPEEAQRMASRVDRAVTAPIRLRDGGTIAVGVSIGIAYASDADEDLEALLRHADKQMYSAKRDSRA
jgi:diguanylate cyclase (GGDEF)-like protein